MSLPALHHVAFACRDLEATHAFYNGVLGFPLVHTEVQEHEGGFLKHVFYDIGDGSCIAFFWLCGVGEPNNYETAISTGLDLPVWVNHIALRADEEMVAAVRERADAAQVKAAMVIDHGWSKSAYYLDPNGILVELCRDDPGFVPDEDEALRLLREPVDIAKGSL